MVDTTMMTQKGMKREREISWGEGRERESDNKKGVS